MTDFQVKIVCLYSQIIVNYIKVKIFFCHLTYTFISYTYHLQNVIIAPGLLVTDTLINGHLK